MAWNEGIGQFFDPDRRIDEDDYESHGYAWIDIPGFADQVVIEVEQSLRSHVSSLIRRHHRTSTTAGGRRRS